MRSVTGLRLLARVLPSLIIVLVVGCKGEKRAEIKESDNGSATPGAPSAADSMEACKTAMTNLGDGTGGHYEAAASACGAACTAGNNDACKFLKAAEVVHANSAAAATAGSGSAGSGAASAEAGSGSGSGSASARVADPKMIDAAKKGGSSLQRQQDRGKQKATSNVESGSRTP